MTFQIIFSDQALLDLNEIYWYIADRLKAPDSALKIIYYRRDTETIIRKEQR